MISQRLKEKIGLEQLIGESSMFLNEIKKIPLAAVCDESVLIWGETGTGKELCARAVHYLSGRAEKPFVPVNCGAIPLELVENELFGHARGAFTGAFSSQTGLLREAEGGTLFLDEIDWLPHLAQVKLLRFLQEKEYRPLGSTKSCSADVRVIAASNMDFEDAVVAGKLRQDLYYRLNVLTMMLPPLRARREDIRLLARHFLRKYLLEFQTPAKEISDSAMQLLTLHDWPGNVRELEHVIKRAVILSERQSIECEDLNLTRREAPQPETFQQAKASVVNQFERSYIQNLLQTYHGNITRAADAAHKNRRAFWQLIRKHNINARNFKL
jgi:transcriptional regulator with PAS, ATPase and Fis domain